MKVITNPSVVLISRQHTIPDGMEKFLEDHGWQWSSDSDVAAEAVCEFNGRVCYLSFKNPRPGGNSAYLHHIKEVGHGSVLEGAVWNFVIYGVSRSFTHELVRHRVGTAFSQLSQRYVDESVAEYVCPDIIANDPELYEIWRDSVEHSHRAYVKISEKLNEKLSVKKRPVECGECDGSGSLLGHTDGDEDCKSCMGTGQNVAEKSALSVAMMLPPNADKTTIRKTARQAARSVLPNATETKIGLTMNARAIRHFLEQRGSRHAETEIRKVANAMLDIMVVEAPNLFSDYKKELLPDGTYELTTPYPKV